MQVLVYSARVQLIAILPNPGDMFVSTKEVLLEFKDMWEEQRSSLELPIMPFLFVCFLEWWVGNCSITESLPELQVRQDLAGALGGQP